MVAAGGWDAAGVNEAAGGKGAAGGNGIGPVGGLAGLGADIAGKKYGLSLSIDTVQGLPERSTIKVLSDLSSTSKGPQ